MKAIKTAFIDTETTGVNWQSGIHQLALIIDINGETVHEKVWEVNPDPSCTIVDQALAVSGKSRADLGSGLLEVNFYREFTNELNRHVGKFDKTDKLHFCAYNAKFDDDRLRDLFRRQKDNYYGSYFWNPVDCVMIHAGLRLKHIRHTLPDFKLGTVCKSLAIEWDDNAAHDALYDIRKTRELNYALASM